MFKKYWFPISIFLITIFAFFIRFYKVTESPPSPYWEEVALGYDAYSIAMTGKDHHGNSLPIVAFESFGDWKPSGYFYAIVPFIKLMGLSVLAVRLPSIIAGTLIVFFIGWLVYLFTDQFKEDKRRKLSIISMLLASISPWLIQFSRAGWEVNLATLSVVAGVAFGWKAVDRKNKKASFWYLLVALLFFVDSMYVYHAARVVSPLLGLFLGIRYLIFNLKNKKDNKKLFIELISLGGILVLLLSPFIVAWGSPVLGQRMAETTIFSDLSIIERSNFFKGMYGNVWWTRFAFHRFWFFSEVVVSQFFQHFSTSFLFIAGDTIARHSSQYFGLFYPFEAIFLFIGSWVLLKKFSLEKKLFLLFWITIGVLPAAISTPTPHALRILPIAPALIILLTIGFCRTYLFLIKEFHCFIPKLKIFKKYSLALLFIVGYSLAFVSFYRHLLNVYPKQYGAEWQVGYEKMIKEVESLRKERPDLPVYITRQEGRPAMYYWFYTKTNPVLVQQADEISKQDQGEYLEFENIKFIRSLDEVVEDPAIVADFFNGEWRTQIFYWRY